MKKGNKKKETIFGWTAQPLTRPTSARQEIKANMQQAHFATPGRDEGREQGKISSQTIEKHKKTKRLKGSQKKAKTTKYVKR